MKTRFCISMYLAFAFLLLSTSGCVQWPRTYSTMFHRGISPINPAMGYSYENRYQTIDTLNPELKWKDLKKTNETYEVCIWETPYKSSADVKRKESQVNTSWGTPIYSATNIVENFHQVTSPLKPATYYNWSVRIRNGEKVSAWSSFSQERSVFNVIMTYDNNPFCFKTPAQ